ncbi:CHAT domain-containing protein [Xylaria longipes]|nr:CHAT domain-containing protein [Xylaria longipes]
MRETPGFSAYGFLPFVADKTKDLHDFSQSSRLRLLTPPPLREEVLQSLEGSTIFHFAGHSKVDPHEPLNSCLLLKDRETHPLTVKLAGCRHVIGTLWQVSNKHCVDLARILYETLLGEGMTDEAVSRGLHQAMRMLKDNGMKTGQRNRHATLHSFDRTEHAPHYWVPYVHYGC